MAYQIDFSIATSGQIEAALCEQVENIRLTRNLTQAQLAHEAGVALKTIRRFEKGEGVSLDTFIRVLMALGLQSNFQNLLPDPTIRPVERVETGGRERKRARPFQAKKESSTWSWGDEEATPSARTPASARRKRRSAAPKAGRRQTANQK